MPYAPTSLPVLSFDATDTLSAGGAGLLHTGTSATLSAGAFASPAGTQILCVDYASPALAAYFSCTVAGTALTNIAFLGGNLSADHAAGAPVASVFTPEHYRVALDGSGWAINAIRLGTASNVSSQTLGTAIADVSNLILAVNVPANGRSVRMTFAGAIQQNSDGLSVVSFYFLKDGANQRAKSVHVSIGGVSLAYTIIYEDPAPTAGAHTYKLQAQYASGASAPFILAGSSLYIDLF